MYNRNEGNIKFVRLEGTADFEMVFGTKVLNVFPVHLHERYCVGAIEKGTAVFRHNNREQVLSPGNIYFVGPHEPHQIRPFDQEGFNHIVFCFGEKFITNLFSDRHNQYVAMKFRTSVIEDKDLCSSIAELCSKIKGKGNRIDVEYELMLIFSRLYQYLLFTEESPGLTDEASNAVLRTSDYIREKLSEDLSLQEMASYAGLSKFHFLRLFREKIGIPPYEYRIQYKIKLAGKLLHEGYSVTHTALELGFADQSHFTRFFKRHMGVTPAQFIK